MGQGASLRRQPTDVLYHSNTTISTSSSNPTDSIICTCFCFKLSKWTLKWKSRHLFLSTSCLSYAKRPGRSSRGFIPLNDLLVLSLPHRPEWYNEHISHIPILFYTTSFDTFWMCTLPTLQHRNGLLKKIQTTRRKNIKKMKKVFQDKDQDDVHDDDDDDDDTSTVIRKEDWILWNSTKRTERWERHYFIYVSSGHLLSYSSSNTLYLEARLNLRDILTYTSDNILQQLNSDQHNTTTTSSSNTPSMKLCFAKEVWTLEFNGIQQALHWHTLIHGAVHERDYAGVRYNAGQTAFRTKKNKRTTKKRGRRKKRSDILAVVSPPPPPSSPSLPPPLPAERITERNTIISPTLFSTSLPSFDEERSRHLRSSRWRSGHPTPRSPRPLFISFYSKQISFPLSPGQQLTREIETKWKTNNDPSQEDKVIMEMVSSKAWSGDWFTTQTSGGIKVRHWQHRKKSIEQK